MFGKQRELGQGRREEHHAHACGAQEVRRAVQLASTTSKNVGLGQADLGLSFYINLFFAYTDSWNVSSEFLLWMWYKK